MKIWNLDFTPMEITFIQIIIAIVGSFIAGGINTLAGNGSSITLTILTELLGLPGNVANGTNRIGVFAQTMASNYAFYKHGKLKFDKRTQLYIVLIITGALLGVWVATRISNESFITVFKYLMVVMFFVILVNPKRWILEHENSRQGPLWISIPLFLALGFYGGFIQMGMGIFFLAIMVLGARYSLIKSNVVKSFVVAIYTAIVIIIFHYKGMIDWKIGGIMAIGQMLGGYFTAVFAAKSPKASVWAYRILVVAILGAIVKLFN